MSTTAQNIVTQNVNHLIVPSLSSLPRQGDSVSHFQVLPLPNSLFFAQKTGATRSASNDVCHGSITILGPLM